jgi:uncharacterized protein DUF5666
MKTERTRTIPLMLTVLLLLIACSNSGGGVGGSGIISRGSITDFGSIVVGGTYFDTRDATVVVDGEEQGVGDAVVLDNLDVGRVVTVIGSFGDDVDTAVADRVVYGDDVKGPVITVSNSEPGIKELTVMGQTVIINALTFFKTTDFNTVAPNDVVEISGYYDDAGTIWATFLEKIGEFNPNVTYEVKGFVDSLDTQQLTFLINNLLVDYSSDTVKLPDEQLEDGLLVEVEGLVDDTFTFMTASQVTIEDDIGVDNADEVEVMGFVTAFVSADAFTVGSQDVVIEASAVFVDGTPADVALGVKLEAEGTLTDGILFAEEIEFWEPDQIEIEGILTDLVSQYEFTVGDQDVITTDLTVYEDGEPQDLVVGIDIEIKGRMQGDVLVADKVSFELGDI